MLSCILGGKFLHVIGREIAIIVGLVFILIQQVGLYELSSINSTNSFLFWSFVA